MFIRKTTALLPAVFFLIFTLAIAGNSNAAAKPEGKATKAESSQSTPASFSKDSNCAVCHQPYVDSMKNDKMLLSKHAAVAGNCFSCHKEDALATAHAKVKGPPSKLFRQRKPPNDMCTKCHGSYDGLMEKTKNSTAFKTTQNVAINPHKTNHGQVECFNCHKMHKDKPPIEYCYGCHHPRQLSNCKDCHAPKKE